MSRLAGLSLLETGALGAALGGAFGFFEQGIEDARERHVLKYAVLGGLGFVAFAALRGTAAPAHVFVGAPAASTCGPDPRSTPAYARWRACVEGPPTGKPSDPNPWAACGPDPGSNEVYMEWVACLWRNGDPAFVSDVQRVIGVRADGVVGPETREALRRLQIVTGQPATGRMDRATLEMVILG